jgi:hypothetical protein
MLACSWQHILFMPSRQNWKVKSDDKRAPVYMLLGMGPSLVSALGFGKPYSPAVITVVGFFVKFGLTLIFPGLLEWLQNKLLVLCVHALFFQLFWRWGRRFYQENVN